MSSLDQARALLQGSYDLHIHPIPSHVPRLLDDFEVLAQAEEAGMRRNLFYKPCFLII